MTGKRIAAIAVLLLMAAAAVLIGSLKPLYSAHRAYEVSFGEEAQSIMDELRARTDDLLAVCGDDALRQAASAYDKAKSPAERREACMEMAAAAQLIKDAQPMTPLLVSELNRLAAALSDTPNTAAAAAEFNRLRNAIPARWFCTLFGIKEL